MALSRFTSSASGVVMATSIGSSILVSCNKNEITTTMITTTVTMIITTDAIIMIIVTTTTMIITTIATQIIT